MKLTHTFMDGRHGGKVVIPPSHTNPVRDAIAADVERGILPPLNELKYYETFNFFCDFDIKADSVEKLPDVQKLAAVVVTVVAKFVTTWPDLRVVVLSAPDKNLGDGTIKRGVHLHFPNLVVGMGESLLMREACADQLTRDMGVIDWADAFDNAPYVNPAGGLRVVGASKAMECSYCCNKLPARKECCQCEYRGKVESSPPQRYTLVSCIGADGLVDEQRTSFLKANVAALVHATAVQTAQGAPVRPEWARFPGCPSFSAPRMSGAKKVPTAGSRKREFAEDKKSMKSWPQIDVVDPAKLKCLQNIFRTRFKFKGDLVYKEIDLMPVKYSSRAGTYFCQFRGVGESFCFNVGRDHRSNRVYGIVNKTTAFVKCHCSCATTDGRQGVRCCSFETKVTIRPNDRAILYAEPVVENKRQKSSADAMFGNTDDFVKYMHEKLYN